MIRRRDNTGGLTWAFPGGKREHKEKLKSAATREVLEETGVTCKPTQKLGSRIHPSTNIEIEYFACMLSRGSTFIQESERSKIAEVAWLTPSEILHVVTTDVFDPVRKYILKAGRRKNLNQQIDMLDSSAST